MPDQPNNKALKENCGNCDSLTWNEKDARWDMSGEFKVIDPINAKCSHTLMTWKSMVDIFRTECLFWTAGVR